MSILAKAGIDPGQPAIVAFHQLRQQATG